MPRWDDEAERLRKAIHWALLDAYLTTCRKNERGAAVAPPTDFERIGGELRFRPGAFADRVAELILQRKLEGGIDVEAIEVRQAEILGDGGGPISDRARD